MNIEFVKELAELNEVKIQADNKLTQMTTEKINKKVYQIKNDFSAYFELNGFSVNENGNIITATYKVLSVILSIDASASKNIGTYLVLNLDTTQINKKSYNISLIRTDVIDQVRVTISNVNEDQKQLNSVRKEIEQTHKRIDNIAQEKWVLTLSDNSKTGRESQTYDNMQELLIDLFK